MAVTYERVCQVISLPPDRRKDFEVNNLLPWFRKKSELFKNLKTRLLVDLIKNLEFSSRAQDDIIIKQGEQGDCMYILLRGQITIYINYALKAESDEGGGTTAAVIDVTNVAKEDLRQHLGTFVTNLGPGATFGEVALMSEDCIRTASIIVNEPSDLIVIDRDLYTRSVKDVLKAEFEEKGNFIANNKYFRNWAPKYRKQLTMALQKETFSYEGLIARQGCPVKAIYCILTGEVKLTMDSQLHQSQYSRLFRGGGGMIEGGGEIGTVTDGDNTKTGTGFNQSGLVPTADEPDSTGRGGSGYIQQDVSTRLPRKRNLVKRLPPVDVCFLGVNESIGDVEVLMGLNTYMQTAQCTQRTEVLVLGHKHYDRLLAKRNKRTVEAMRADLEERLRWRSQPQHCANLVPLLPALLAQAAAHNESERARARARQSNLQTSMSQSESKTAETIVPERGLLVDINGPGTVFYRIRQDYEKHHPQMTSVTSDVRNKNKHRPVASIDHASRDARRSDARLSTNSEWMETDIEDMGSNLVTAARRRKDRRRKEFLVEGLEEEVDKETSDLALSELEERLRGWLKSEGDRDEKIYDRVGLAAAPIPVGWLTPRVTKLHRVENCEPDDLKPGSKILLRPKRALNLPPPSMVRSDMEIIHKDRHRTLSELGYYQMALTASLPNIRYAAKRSRPLEPAENLVEFS